MNSQLFYNYIADYKDRSGKDYYNVFKIPSFCVTDEQDGARYIKAALINDGYTPLAIVNVAGDYSMEELQQLADGKLYPRNVLVDNLKQSPIKPI